jgi:hypothetical protein
MPVAPLPIFLVVLIVPLALFIVLFGKLLKYVECVVGVAKAGILRGVVTEDDWDGLSHSNAIVLDMDRVLSGYSRWISVVRVRGSFFALMTSVVVMVTLFARVI